jgi:hypothetical protein
MNLLHHSKDAIFRDRQRWFRQRRSGKLLNQTPITAAQNLWRQNMEVTENPEKANALPS